jgi:sigma-E factor negative regulatory protein RseB
MRGLARRAGPIWLPAIALGVACTAQAAPGNDPQAWLQRAASAARSANYAGTFLHTNGDRTSTVRITHVNVGNEEHERIETLDGAPHEIVRRNEEMFCYFPDAKTVRLDRRIARFFPSILRSTPEAIAASYDVKLGNHERILSYECQWIRLEPKDRMRFEQRLCAEVNTGLVLRAKTLNDQHQVVEQYTFTDLRLGPQVARAADVRSSFEARIRQWRADRTQREDTKSVDTGWIVTNVPAGFQKVTEVRRVMPGRSQPVSQIVLSDGLASMSVFVEPNPSPAKTGEASREDGTTAFFVRPVGEHLVTVLGEVPLATAQQVARSVARRP